MSDAKLVPYEGFPDGVTDDFVEHAAKTRSQYDTTARALAAEVVRLRAELRASVDISEATHRAISEALQQIGRSDEKAKRLLRAMLPEVRKLLKGCQSVRLDDMDAYLVRRGWTLEGVSPFKRKTYKLPGAIKWLDRKDPTAAWLDVPGMSSDHYAEEIVRVVEELARVERRSASEILADINAVVGSREGFAIGARVEVVKSEEGPHARVFQGMEGTIVHGLREYPGCVQVEFRDEDGEEEPRDCAVNVALLRLISEDE